MSRLTWICLFLFISGEVLSQNYRSIDGKFNHIDNVNWGAKDEMLTQKTTLKYADNISTPTGENRPNPRHISNYIFEQTERTVDKYQLSDFLWVFGQFIDHDISLIETNHFEPLFISVPEDDEHFSPDQSLLMFRSEGAHGTGTDIENPRRYVNKVTAYIDGSQVYGSDNRRSEWLRTFENGKLKTSSGNLLPWNTTTGEYNDPIDDSAPFMEDALNSGQKLYVAGDIRANENPLLIVMHTLFLREHNRLCEELKQGNPNWDDNQLYLEARKLNIAYMQRIAYYEWMPALGIELPKYTGYKPDIEAQISNVFSAAAFRIGHTLINDNLLRMTDGGEEIKQGNISLKDAFFNPLAINFAGGLDPYLVGMAVQIQQQMDCKLVGDVRNFLFGQSGTGMDLAAININRGRERGLGNFNSIRKDFGLPEIKSFEEFTELPEDAASLKKLYSDVNDMDPWVAMLAEKHMPNSIIGNTLLTILESQFRDLRDGDRFYFENDPLLEEDIQSIKNTSLHDIIMRNSSVEVMQDEVFYASKRDQHHYGPEIGESDLAAAIYPNPNNGTFTIKVRNSKEIAQASIKIYDTLGKLVSTQNTTLEEGENFINMNIGPEYNSGFFNVVIERGLVDYTIVRVLKK